MFDVVKSSKVTYIVTALYLIIIGWWILLQNGHGGDPHKFNWSYGLIALVGSLFAWYVAFRQWGGFKSVFGRLIFFLGLGLFSEWFGLQIWTYYNVIKHVEVPYPSWADVGYFGIIPAYSYASWMLAKSCALKLSAKKIQAKLIILIVPIVMLGLAYSLFLKDVGFKDQTFLTNFLNIGYPAGDVIAPTVAIITALLVTSVLGGLMKTRILFLIFAFLVQFGTDYLFLYQSGAGTYKNGGVSDLLYATSYFIMSLAIISLSKIEPIALSKTGNQAQDNGK